MKTYNVRITRQAAQHLESILDYIAIDLSSPDAAERLRVLLKEEIESLSTFPERIKLVDDEPWRSEGIRRKPVHNYYVYFWIDEENKKVQVISVVYVKREQNTQMEKMERY